MKPLPAPATIPLERMRFAPLVSSTGEDTRATLRALFSAQFEDPLDAALSIDIDDESPEIDPPAGAAILLAPIPESLDPALERALVNTLPEPTRARLGRFAHPLRRRQSLFGRLLAQRLANLASECADGAYYLREQPPEGPLLADCEGRCIGRFAVAHTALGVAVSLSRRPMGIDLETRHDRPKLAELAGFALGEAFGERIAALHRADPARAVEVFFAAWGAIESEQKMNGEDRKSAAAAITPELDGMLQKYARPQAVDVAWDDRTPGVCARSPLGEAVPLEYLNTPVGLLTTLGAPAGRSIELLSITPEGLLAELETHFRSFL